MEENKRLIAVGAVILAIVVLILAIAFWPEADHSFACKVKGDKEYSKIGAVNYKQYKCLVEEDGKKAIVYTTKMTDKKKEVLNEAATKLGTSIYYINTDKIKDKDLKVIKKKLKSGDLTLKKDAIIVLNKGKIETFKEDILAKVDEIKTFLKDAKLAKFMCDVTPSEEYPNFAEVTLDQYKCLYESEEPFAIMFSQTTCGHCQNFKPYINEFVGKNNIPFYVIEVDQLSSDERTELLGTLSYFDENENWGTPITFGVKNKEITAELSGDNENDDEVTDFFKQAGLLK